MTSLAIAVLFFLNLSVVSWGPPLQSSRQSVVESSVQKSKDPEQAPEGPKQPIPYSHKKHLALGLKCVECHPNPDPGDRMTIPGAPKCMQCHVTIAKDTAAIKKLADFASSGTEIPWVRVYIVPSWVYWNHRSHLAEGIACEGCHGQVAGLEVMNKLTNVTSMAACIDCHRKQNASTGCRFCHSDK